MSLAGRIALVTGANRGIGFEIARQLGRAGATVIVAARHAAAAEEAVKTLRAEGYQAEPRELDISQADQVARVAASLAQVHILVNNAGMIDEPVPTWEEPIAGWDEVLNTNLRGCFLMCRAFVPGMRAQHWGRIINLSSGMGTFSDGLDGGHPAYRVSKAGINALTLNLAHELKDTPIQVNAVCPGWVKTEMGGPNAPRTVEEGADTITFLAAQPDGAATGKLWRDRAVIPW